MRHDTTQLFGEALGHLFMYSGPGMNVSICCEVVVAMPQPGLNIFQGVVQIQHNRGTAMPLWHNKDKSENPCGARSWRFVLILFPLKTALKSGLWEGNVIKLGIRRR